MKIKQYDLLPSSVPNIRGIVNVFSSVIALPEQEHGLLECYNIGTEENNSYVSYNLLRIPNNVKAPVKHQKLLTMSSPSKGKKKRVSQQEKEQRILNKCLRKRLAWCSKTNLSYNTSAEQYTVMPRALCDSEGFPNKGNKQNWTDKLQKRYSILTPDLPLSWTPEAVLMDRMFFINITPLQHTSNVQEYGKFIFRRFLHPHYSKGTNEVHLLFDSPQPQMFNPKEYEQHRRDRNVSQSTSSHTHTTFNPSSPIPRPWRTCIDCRQCKRSVIEAIGLSYIRSAKYYLQQVTSLGRMFLR